MPNQIIHDLIMYIYTNNAQGPAQRLIILYNFVWLSKSMPFWPKPKNVRSQQCCYTLTYIYM